jgi:hypothetical protein
MKSPLLLLLVSVLSALSLQAQQTERPAYCDDLPVSYDARISKPDALPRFQTIPTMEYKVQVAILRYTDPTEYPFHPDLVARWRPCEQVWVIESRQSYPNRDQALALRDKLVELGYTGAYLIELIGYR